MLQNLFFIQPNTVDLILFILLVDLVFLSCRNPRLSCQSLPSLDFNVWRENAAQGCQIAGRTIPIGDTALPTPCTSCVCTSEGVSGS